MSRNKCWVELIDNRAVRIFHNRIDAIKSPAYEEDRLVEWPRKDATFQIRDFVFKRAAGQCERCGKRLSWPQGHMDERVSRGEGGEMSIFNSWWLCYDCHINIEHGNRRLQS